MTEGVIWHQPKQCIIIGEIPENSHTFVLFDQDPPKIGNCMTPVHFVAACFLVKKFLVEFSHMQQRPWTCFLKSWFKSTVTHRPRQALILSDETQVVRCLWIQVFFEANNFGPTKNYSHTSQNDSKRCVFTPSRCTLPCGRLNLKQRKRGSWSADQSGAHWFRVTNSGGRSRTWCQTARSLDSESVLALRFPPYTATCMEALPPATARLDALPPLYSRSWLPDLFLILARRASTEIKASAVLQEVNWLFWIVAPQLLQDLHHPLQPFVHGEVKTKTSFVRNMFIFFS